MIKAIEIENLTVHYGQHPAITDVNLTINEGDFLGIMGPNGGGKSTLVKAILGIIPKTKGKILVYGEDIEKNRKKIGYVSQFSDVDKSFPISVLEVAMTGMMKGSLHPFFRYSAENKKIAHEKLEFVGIDDLANRQISMLSGGEFQRLLIARALATEPQILFLDEPTASVDPASRNAIFQLLEKLNKKMTIVLITHDMTAISSTVKSIACLNEKLVYHGEPEFNEKVVNELYGCPVDLIAHGVPHRVLHDHDGGDCQC
ncbi:MAG: ABC transporter ATP-binding protein [Oscillospiraceae bacterium]